MIKQKIEEDLKKAMLAGEKEEVSVLRTIKSALLDEEVNSGKREQGLSDNESITVLQKEKKKRIDSATIYKDANDKERADQELHEVDILERYLPTMMEEAQIKSVVRDVVSKSGEVTMKDMGKIIGQVKAQTGPLAEGSTIAKLVKEELSKKQENS